MKACIQAGAAVLLACFASLCFTENPARDTDWMSPEAGFKEGKMGVRIHSVTEMDKDGMQRIEISLPDADLAIEEVIVLGQEIDKPEIEQPKRFEYVNDLETGRRGIVIYIGKRQKFALKFNYDEGNARFPYD